MLKRQRPATPPPSSLDDYPFDSLIRPPPTIDSSQPRSKRQRTRPPPLDGALRGWLESGPSPHGDSDGEEDWTEDAGDAVTSSLPPSTTPDQYKDTNSLLHELHVLNQHRLLFVHSPRDRSLNPARHNHTQGPLVQEGCTLPYRTAFPQPKLESQSCFIGSQAKKGLVEEVECVRQRYEDANRLLGSLFLSRRREVESNPPLTPHSDGYP